MGEIVRAVGAAWRWARTDVLYLHSIDFKWLVIGFTAAALLTAYARGIALRRLYRKNRLLNLLVSVQAANDELRRRGSDLRIDTNDVEV